MKRDLKKPMSRVRLRCIHWCAVLLAAIAAAGIPLPARAQMVTGPAMTDFDSVFNVQRTPASEPYSVELVRSSIPGNILWPGDKLTVTVQVRNNLDKPLNAEGRLEVIPYGTKGKPGDVWVPTVIRLAAASSIPVRFQAAAGASVEVTVSPPIPARFGAYGLVMDLDSPADSQVAPLVAPDPGSRPNRRFVASVVRTFRPDPVVTEYPALSLDDNVGVDALSRLGVHAIRWGIGYKPTTDSDFERWYRERGARLKDYQAHGITVLAMIGGGAFTGPTQPLGRPRPWLDDHNTMMDTKFDLAWLPSYDADFQKFVTRFCTDYGWPRGPITACSLWNEPWEGISISGWGADMLRYRTIYAHMAAGVRSARQSAGASVLVGGCDSSSNALDKLFPDGSSRFLPDFDFLSVHYQGMTSFANYKPWVNRKSARGRVRIWDTESWVANTDDRVAAVIAANRSAGYDRAMGVFGGNVHEGQNAWSVAAAVGAAQHFIGDRPFHRLLFKNGLPWVMVFDGLRGSREDGTAVVVGDLGEEFGVDNLLFRTARGLAEVAHKEQLRRELANVALDQTPGQADALDPKAQGLRSRGDAAPVAGRAPTGRDTLLEALAAPETLSGASMTLSDRGGVVYAYDFYGNRVPARGGRITIPLDGRGFFLRGSGAPGSFQALLDAIRTSRVEGIEPLAVVAHDLTAPVSTKPLFRLSLTNVLNRTVTGELSVSIGGLSVTPARQRLVFGPDETRQVNVRVSGKAAASNTYPLSLHFDAGRDGAAVHYEAMHVNLVARRHIVVDGNLSDWRGVLPETIVSETAGPTLAEAAWFPFRKFTPAAGKGTATAYLACDDRYFYFAVRVPDATQDSGTLRFATRNDDAFFYPEVSYVRRLTDPKIAPVLGSDTDTPQPLRWPQGIRRYSYRKDPVLPAGNFPNFDNVQIAFNVLPQSKKQFLASPPGTMPDYTISPDSDYEYALNKVAPRYGGGTEVWRLNAPGMPLKHFYPRQPRSPYDGPVKGAKLVVVQNG
ncbi:MAG: hypothetical protein LC772_07645, partial [Chloroflexi bacterium]|nr:hypothetical protein [Chloroflexota bacterium]